MTLEADSKGWDVLEHKLATWDAMYAAIHQVTTEHLGVAEKNGFDRCGCEVCATLLPALEQAERNHA